MAKLCQKTKGKANSEEKIMAKLCPRGKAAAKRKFKVYPLHTLTCMHQQYVQVKLHQVARRKIKKAMGGGMMRTELRIGGLARRKRMSCA